MTRYPLRSLEVGGRFIIANPRKWLRHHLHWTARMMGRRIKTRTLTVGLEVTRVE